MTPAEAQELRDQYPSTAAAARAAGVPRETLRNKLRKAPQRAVAQPKIAAILQYGKRPRTEIPAKQLLRQLRSEYERKVEIDRKQRWFKATAPGRKPFGILWFGDPHIGDHCNIERLERDVQLCVKTPGMYAANIGDVNDNWTGKLIRLALGERTTRNDERGLARWFLKDAGLSWLLWLDGNHDKWNDHAAFVRGMDVEHCVPMFNWGTRIRIRLPDRSEVRINARHDFRGSSELNPTHGPAKAARMLGDRCHVYVCGHRHTWGVQQFEVPDAGMFPLSIRARGYKFMDEYARELGYPEDKQGCSILTIIDPTAEEGPGRVLAFADPVQGARVLTALRGGRRRA